MRFEDYRLPGRVHRRTVAAKASSELCQLFQATFIDDDWTFETRLNGSFANSVMTNSSDIDFLITLTNPMWAACDHHLVDKESSRRAPLMIRRSWERFRERILTTVEQRFGPRAVTDNSKAIQVDSARLGVPIDIVVTVGFQYGGDSVTPTRRVDSAVLLWTDDGTELLHFPFLHRRIGRIKQRTTNGGYQRAVRDLKSIRDTLVDKERLPPNSAPGYYIEHLCRSVPDWVYEKGDYPSVCGVVAYLQTKPLNGQTIIAGSKPMFGSHELQWSVENCRLLLQEATTLLRADMEAPSPLHLSQFPAADK